MAVGAPGGSGSYVPTLELSGNLMVHYGRDLKASAVNRVAKVTPVKQRRGAYLQFDPLSIARLTNLPYSTHWPLGGLRPTGHDNKLLFQQQTFSCSRENFNTTLDTTSLDLANWPMLKMHSEILAQRAMTYKAYRVFTTLFTQSLYAATHVVTATVASGGAGFLQSGTTADNRIKNAFDYAARLIQQDTNGAVRFGNLSVVMNSTTALRLSSSRELREYMMQQPGARDLITLKDKQWNQIYGLPETLYGYRVIVDDTYYNASEQNETGAVPGPVVPDNQIAVCFTDDGEMERPDSLAPSFNTVHLFAFEEFTVEATPDQRNRLTFLDVVMDFDVQVVAPPTGVIITNVFS